MRQLANNSLSLAFKKYKLAVYTFRGQLMKTTRVFKCGNSLAVRLPKGFHLSSDEVEIFRRDKEIVIREIPKNLTQVFELLTQFPADFFPKGRKDTPPQDRDF